jgi:predicted amidohydrolase YtcJ
MISPSSRAAFVNGRIYTVDSERSWAEAILVEDGKISLVGSSEDIAAAAGITSRTLCGAYRSDRGG